MSKAKLRDDTRLRALELAAQIAGEAAHNTNVVWMIEFQEELVERLYRKMIALMEEGVNDRDDDDEDDNSEDSQVTEKKAKKRKK